ncbi:unnamed protein product [Heterobilharzia americana]|nr:unnamed protein product [Heterobilharzia americana]
MPFFSIGTTKIMGRSIFFAVPKKRRTVEQRRIRKFLSLRSGDYNPREDLTPCKFCGHLNPRDFLCTNCYSKVRQETNFLRSLINSRLPSDREVQFVYDNEKGIDEADGTADVKVSGSRPSWFPSVLRKSKSSDGENS